MISLFFIICHHYDWDSHSFLRNSTRHLYWLSNWTPIGISIASYSASAYPLPTHVSILQLYFIWFPGSPIFSFFCHPAHQLSIFTTRLLICKNKGHKYMDFSFCSFTDFVYSASFSRICSGRARLNCAGSSRLYTKEIINTDTSWYYVRVFAWRSPRFSFLPKLVSIFEFCQFGQSPSPELVILSLFLQNLR